MPCCSVQACCLHCVLKDYVNLQLKEHGFADLDAAIKQPVLAPNIPVIRPAVFPQFAAHLVHKILPDASSQSVTGAIGVRLTPASGTESPDRSVSTLSTALKPWMNLRAMSARQTPSQSSGCERRLH